MKYLSSLAAASVAAFFFSLTALLWIYAPRVILHADGVLTRAEGVESKINASAVNLDKATAAWASSAKAQTNAVTDLVTDAHGTLSSANDTLSALQGDASAIQGSADALTGEIGALRATTDTATAAINDARPAIQGIRPTEDQATAALTAFNRILDSKDLSDGLHGFAVTADNAGGITGDFRARFHDILYPPPCKTFGCRLSKEVWPALKDGGALGESAYWTIQLLKSAKP